MHASNGKTEVDMSRIRRAMIAIANAAKPFMDQSTELQAAWAEVRDIILPKDATLPPGRGGRLTAKRKIVQRMIQNKRGGQVLCKLECGHVQFTAGKVNAYCKECENEWTTSRPKPRRSSPKKEKKRMTNFKGVYFEVRTYAGAWMLTCPLCELKGRLDAAQVKGHKEVKCPNEDCSFTALRDFRRFIQEIAD